MCYSALASHTEVIRPVAACRDSLCPFTLMSGHDEQAVRDGARQHAEATGHPVMVEVISHTIYTPRNDSPQRRAES